MKRWACVALDWHPELDGQELGRLWSMGAARFYTAPRPAEAARVAATEELGGRMLVLVSGDAAWPQHVFHALRTCSCARGLGAWLFVADVELRLHDLTPYWQRACADLQVVRFNERYPDGTPMYYLSSSGVRDVHVRGRAFVDHDGQPVVGLVEVKGRVHLGQLHGIEQGPFSWAAMSARALTTES
ncbi:hypothetical protein [Nannocystis sp. SCPEA4]|uniref:hypothetical protein n=1 Tax=Nannocystis sp. SCPEA4 TaxID=2996787 RepID=UPI0022719A16|nr:hypothetical protein [Nannocystis sp. SCPEA4]